MKVIPKIKRKTIDPDEIRVININEDAISELLLEHLMEHNSDYLDMPSVSDDHICIMDWDQQNHHLIYAVMPLEICMKGYTLDCNYLRQTVGMTVSSLYAPNQCKYKSVKITKEMLKKR